MAKTASVYQTLAKEDVSGRVEKKGRFSYLSWSDAIHFLLKHYPEATWHVVKDGNKPYFQTDFGVFVEVEVIIDGLTRAQIHPVLNHQNKPIEKPTSFEINTSIQRCLAKAIALHGLGLNVYRGEDFPPDDLGETPKRTTKTPPKQEPEVVEPLPKAPEGYLWCTDFKGECWDCQLNLTHGDNVLFRSNGGVGVCELHGRVKCETG